MRRVPKLPHVKQEPAPAASKRDSMLAQAQTMSNAVRGRFKKGKKSPCNSSWEGGVRKCQRNNLAYTKVSEGWGGDGPGMGAEVLHTVERSMVEQAVPLQFIVYL